MSKSTAKPITAPAGCTLTRGEMDVPVGVIVRNGVRVPYYAPPPSSRIDCNAFNDALDTLKSGVLQFGREDLLTEALSQEERVALCNSSSFHFVNTKHRKGHALLVQIHTVYGSSSAGNMLTKANQWHFERCARSTDTTFDNWPQRLAGFMKAMNMTVPEFLTPSLTAYETREKVGEKIVAGKATTAKENDNKKDMLKPSEREEFLTLVKALKAINESSRLAPSKKVLEHIHTTADKALKQVSIAPM